MLDNVNWMNNPDIKPYIFMRRENLFARPGSTHQCDWFTRDILFKDPLKMSEVSFADMILELEGKAFSKADMKMPRWVFYDCAIVPGFVCGFVQRRSSMDGHLLEVLQPPEDQEWVPISLFIIIPTVRQGEWVAHNLCTANSLIKDKEKRYYALGFLSKAFGLWYANVEILCGMTQWGSPAIKLHSHYGPFEVLTAYTPVHSYAQTLTYRSKIDSSYWGSFINKVKSPEAHLYQETGLEVNPAADESLKDLQSKIESGEGPFFLKPSDVRAKSLKDSLGPLSTCANV